MITASIMSRFNSRNGSASTKGCVERITKLGGRIKTEGLIVTFECDDRAQLDKIALRLKMYSGLKRKFPMRIESFE